MQDLAVLTAVALLVWLVVSSLVKRKRSKLPPGPPGLPIVGNILDIPTNFPWLKYQNLAHEYDSDIVSLSFLGTPVIVLNSVKSANDLFEKRSAIYSDRNHTVMIHELTGWARNTAQTEYGDEWRAHRRIFSQHFGQKAVRAFHPQSTRKVRMLLKRLLDTPQDFLAHSRWMPGALILEIAYGLDIQSERDPYILDAETALRSLAKIGNIGSYMVDTIPILKHLPSWFPGALFQRQAIEWKKAVDKMFDRPFDSVKEAMGRGTAAPSIVSAFLAQSREDAAKAKQESVFQNAVGTMFAGGADTTVSSLQTFFLAMMLFPEVQRRAQEELDEVIGQDRLPEFEDRDSLPFITVVVYETLRWRPVTPLVLHKSTAEDEYGGYRIPVHSIVIGNVWAMLHNEETYPEPDRFNPGRFLSPNGQLNPDVPSPSVAFGFGRRICPGRHFAMDSLWMAIASILATFTIEKPVDKNGRVVEPSGEYISGFLVYPAPFEASFKPRSASAAELVQVVN